MFALMGVRSFAFPFDKMSSGILVFVRDMIIFNRKPGPRNRWVLVRCQSTDWYVVYSHLQKRCSTWILAQPVVVFVVVEVCNYFRRAVNCLFPLRGKLSFYMNAASFNNCGDNQLVAYTYKAHYVNYPVVALRNFPHVLYLDFGSIYFNCTYSCTYLSTGLFLSHYATNIVTSRRSLLY